MNLSPSLALLFTVLLNVALSPSAFAQADPTTTPSDTESTDLPGSTSRQLRSQDRIGIHHAPYALGYYITVRESTAVSYNTHPNETWEFEWVNAELGFGYWGIDLVKLTENYFNFNYRSFGLLNSFNWKVGLGYREIDLSVGSELLKNVTQEDVYLNILNEQAITINSGVGNRWQWDWGGTLSVDWIETYIPIYRTSNQNAGQEYADDKTKKDIDKGMKALSSIPTATILKVQMGYSF